MPETKFKRWDEYVAEADHPDFEIPVDDERTIHIKAPTGEQVFAAGKAQADGDAESMLRLACGDAADEVLELVKAAPYGAMTALAGDIMRHFGFDTAGESSASST